MDAARNQILQGRIQGPPLKINFQGRAMALTTPRNSFSGAAHPVSRPWKWFFQGRLTPSPAPGKPFTGAVQSMSRPWNSFPTKPKFEIPFKFLFPANLLNRFLSVFNYSIFYFLLIFTCKAIAPFDSGFQNFISVLFKFVFPANSILILDFLIDDEYIS